MRSKQPYRCGSTHTFSPFSLWYVMCLFPTDDCKGDTNEG